MGRYAAFRYGTGTLYGFQGRPESGTFLLAQAVDYGRVRLTAYSEANIGSGYVLIRSNSGPAEYPSDGVVISSGVLSTSQLVVTDGLENYLDGTTSNDIDVPSGQVFYTFFVFSLSGFWRKDAATSVIVPRNRRSLETMINGLPGVLANSTGNPLDSRELNSDLARFLGGFAVTYDELLTWLDILLPSNARSDGVVRGLHESLARSVGMPVEYTVGIAATSRLFRNSGDIYRSKGTVYGVQAYTEALTGWSARVSNATNLIKSLDDASFEASTGSWTATGGTLVQEQVDDVNFVAPVLAHDYFLWPFSKDGIGVATIGSGGSLLLELPELVGHGTPTGSSTGRSLTDRMSCIPVVPNFDYEFSGYFLSPDSGVAMTLGVEWLNSSGEPIQVDEATDEPLTTEWARVQRYISSPSTAAFAKLQIRLEGTQGKTIHLDQLQFAFGDSVYHEPKTVNIALDPKRINLLSDPTFNAEVFWTATSGSIARTTAESALGDSAAVMTGTPFEVVSEAVPARSGYVMDFSAYLLGDPVTINVEFLDGRGNALDTSTPNTQATSLYSYELTTESYDEWTRVSVTSLTPIRDPRQAELSGAYDIVERFLILEEAADWEFLEPSEKPSTIEAILEYLESKLVALQEAADWGYESVEDPTSTIPERIEALNLAIDALEEVADWGQGPPPADSMRIRITGSGTTYIDAVLLEKSDAAQVFFDSITADQEGEDAKLVTHDGHQYSVLYPGWLTKLSRLKTTLPYYLPPTVNSRVILWDADDPEITDYLPYGPE